MATYPHLFRPLGIGRIEVKNRLFFPSHGTSLIEQGHAGPNLIAYHEARAAGGSGLIILEGSAMHSSFDYRSRYLSVADDDCIPGLRDLAVAVHRHGCKVFGQLFHAGRGLRASEDGSRPVAYAPSEVPDERYGIVPAPLPKRMVRDFVDSYGDAARRMNEAGLDGCEVLASMGYLIALFLNPAANLRTDRYGGSPGNRMRFLREIIRAMRAKTDPGFVIGIRISGDEMAPGGLEPDAVRAICRALDADGSIDFVNVIAGSVGTMEGWKHVFPPMAVPPGYVAPLAAGIKAVMTKPVLVAGRITQPQLAELIVAGGQADMVGVVRAQIADPEFVNKARSGRIDDIRACIGCNQACVGHRLAMYPVSCIQHPETGRERRFPHRKARAATARRVMVVGGGPAGMKAAAIAAERGHDVTLYERAGQLGGQVLLAQALPGRAEFGGLATNLARELDLAGAKVVRGRDVTAEAIRADGPDVVILATGALPRLPAIAAEGAHVVEAWSVIRGEANTGGSVVVADWRGDWIGLGVAEKLARAGCRVTLAVNAVAAGMYIQEIVRDTWVGELHKLGVAMVPYARLVGADRTTAYFQHTASGEPILIEGVDTLVLAQGHRRESTLADAMNGYPGKVMAIGDCVSPRTAEEAVFDGLKAAMEIGA
ncbi:MAG: FAD-binding protein [Alphaproteobacteria bacterium]|nr:FAD-binding protein [Alphaproteobacteria bacterium]